MKKKILFVITQFYKGGAETSLLNLFHCLDSQKYEVDFLVLNQIEYQDATSLMGEVPEWIHVFDAVKNRGNGVKLEQLAGKIYRRLFHTETYVKSAVDFVKNRKYDVAISFGEWLSPAFLVKKVNAVKKYVWIHIDLDKADFVNKEELVKYDSRITGYIFASEKSRQSSIHRCPQMTEKSIVVHNILNRQNILSRSAEDVTLPQANDSFLLSVGNLRVEKNYPRQIEVMRILKKKKIPIKWICIGSTVDKNVYGEVSELLEKYQLKDDFILCGADDNPYKYMKRAKAVMVLSDHESWSLVISEAKLLGVPVIATNTSGAQEQIVNGETGIITSFQVEEIAEEIEEFLNDLELQNKIKKNLILDNTQNLGILEFEDLLER
ncbi:glycosyltransferase [Lachnoclostridium sp. Marseille-P6806]|uniref:glycosyltransferase n=1 Tax=Lachnoclostridium sp. Marseille-P6806 TaxID=2364793 RepID=UPI0035627932